MSEAIETGWADTQSEASPSSWQEPQFMVGGHVVDTTADWSLEILTGHMLALEWWMRSED